jgi:hypothetical protein
MSLLSLLIASSIVAAAAFFLAGLLLRSPRGQQPAETGPSANEGLAREIERLRDRQKFVESALEEARAACKSEAGARQREEERRSLAEGELDKARSEAERLSTNERTSAERLRNAEDQNRAFIDREETNAEGWKTQLDAAQAEQKRQIRTLREEVDRLGAEIARQKAERIRLVEERDRHATRATDTERALADLQARSIEQSQQHDHVREGLEGAVRAAEERERGALRRLAEAEVAHEGKSETVRESSQALQVLQAAIQGERLQWAERIQRAEVACQAELDEKRGLGVRLRALEAEVECEREQGRGAAEALRDAEARLADLDRLLDRLARENSELRAQQAEAAREVKWQVGRDDPARDVKVELAAAQAKLTELEGALEENRKLRDEVAELRRHQEATGELERLASAHKQLRLDAELMARRLQELLQDRAELVSLRGQAAEAASLVEEVAYLRRREKDLEAQLYASGLGASREIAAASGEPPAQTPVSDMKTNLHSLVGDGGPRTAVLADAQGFLIASDGESAVQESLAAFTAVAGEMVTRARMLLPLAEVGSVRVTDKNHTVLTCHLFNSAGEGLGIATLGPGEPSARGTAQAIVELAAIVGGAEPTTDEEPEPATG